ncbi:MAG: amino acid adenylation domain-containing protein [Oligoflexia bacterium]|nr:amino acid adenylation domain-containing protein [Oligoflexia bacterium]
MKLISSQRVEELNEVELFPAAEFEKEVKLNECLHEIFEQQVDKNPHQQALIFKSVILSYQELDCEANKLAHYLIENGVRSKDLVAIFLNRSHQAIISILAILKAGAAYVPIDPSFPAERIDHILSDAKVKMLLTENALIEEMGNFNGQVLVLDNQKQKWIIECSSSERLDRVKSGVLAFDLCYIIYTSGSTGRPKGIMTEHRNSVSFVKSFKKVCQLNPNDRIYQGFSLSFDGSVEEMWMAFSNGATLVIGPQEIGKLAEETANYINENNVTVFSTVPTFLSMIGSDLPKVRLLILSGEQCPQELANKWPNDKRRLLNVYGPTETTVNATAKECRPYEMVTIGRALEGYTLHILDEKMFAVAKGEIGELYIEGEGLARGYLNLDQITKKSFIQDPLATDGKRFYKTGDLVKENENGELLFLGRVDTQVKVRGHRVELAEIETLLLECKAIQSAAVKVYESESGQELAAYVTLNKNHQQLNQSANNLFNQDEILNLLSNKLPPYMIPTYLEVLDSFPLLNSGKVDRKNLPVPKNPLVRNNRNIVPPQSILEASLKKIWENLLKIDPISVEDDFFMDLGGYSLMAARLASGIRNELSLNIAIRDIYQHNTIRKMASYLQPKEKFKAESTIAAETFKKLSKKFYPICVILQTLSLYPLYAISTIPMAIMFLMGLEIFLGNLDLKSGIYISLLLFFLLPILIPAFSIVMKWLIIGKFKAGRYPLWSFYYFRWWLVDRIHTASGISIYAGTPIINLYYRLMGASISRDTIIDTPLLSTFDLISIGKNSSICSETQILGYRVENGFLILGNVDIGNDCFVGIHSCIGLNCKMEDGAKLGDLSLVADNQLLKHDDFYAGSPAEKVHDNKFTNKNNKSDEKKRHPIIFSIIFYFAPLLMGLFFLLVSVPSIALSIFAYQLGGISYTIASAFLFVPLEVLMICLAFALLKKIVLPKYAPGIYSIESFFYIRKWFVDSMLRLLTTSILKTVYTTIYLPGWLRLLGAKIGKRAEISTVSQISPELMELGEESFFADGSIIGGRHFYDGKMQIDRSKIGDRSFIGNSAIMPIGAEVGNDCLIGCLSTPPLAIARAADGTEWLGSPPFNLPFRKKVKGFSKDVTYKPTVKLYIERLLVDALRILLPGYIGIAAALLWVAAVYFTYQNIASNIIYTVLLSPFYAIISTLIAALTVVIFKKIIMGTFRPEIKPLWSLYVWFNEVLNGMYESIAVNAMSSLLGTPFISSYLRLLGCKIGKRVYLNTTLFSEFDLVEIADYSALNAGVIVQNHLFEDRIFKSSYLKIGESCSLGNMSVILYDTIMEKNSNVGPLSLLMKGETLAPNSRWIGIPTKRC